MIAFLCSSVNCGAFFSGFGFSSKSKASCFGAIFVSLVNFGFATGLVVGAFSIEVSSVGVAFVVVSTTGLVAFFATGFFAFGVVIVGLFSIEASVFTTSTGIGF